MQLHYKKVGKGPAIIILHGLYGSGDNWLSFAQTLQDKYTVYLPDMRNHGNSQHSDEFNYNAMTSDIYGLIQDQDIKQVTLMGHSMGGRIAMRFAELHGELVNKLVVIDISPVTDQSKTRLQAMFRSHAEIVKALLDMPLHQITTYDEADAELEKSMPLQDIRQFLLKNLKRDENQKFYWQINLPSIATNLEEIIIGSETMNSRLECQTLFIKGQMSAYLTVKDAEVLGRYFSNMQFEVVKGAGHWVHSDNPGEFKAIVTDFLLA